MFHKIVLRVRAVLNRIKPPANPLAGLEMRDYNTIISKPTLDAAVRLMLSVRHKLPDRRAMRGFVLGRLASGLLWPVAAYSACRTRGGVQLNTTLALARELMGSTDHGVVVEYEDEKGAQWLLSHKKDFETTFPDRNVRVCKATITVDEVLARRCTCRFPIACRDARITIMEAHRK